MVRSIRKRICSPSRPRYKIWLNLHESASTQVNITRLSILEGNECEEQKTDYLIHHV